MSGFRKHLYDHFTARSETAANTHAAAKIENLEARLLLSGTTYIVDSLEADIALDGELTLPEAIFAANANMAAYDAPAGSATETDIIEFSPSLFTGGTATITLTGTKMIIDDSVEINGPGQDLLTIDAGDLSGIFATTDDATDVTIQDMTLINGNSNYGAAVQAASGALTLKNLYISNCSAYGGGAIYSTSEAAGFSGLTLTGNYGEYGGAIYNGGGSMTILTSHITGNASQYGGDGIYSTANLVVGYTDITGNTGQGGGLVSASGTASLVLAFSDVLNNTSTNCGGGVALYGGSALVHEVNIAGNTLTNTYGSGGGIYSISTNLTVESSIIFMNRTLTGGYGGGIYVSGGTMSVRDSAICSNYAGLYGGGIRMMESAVVLTQAIITNNVSDSNGGAIEQDGGSMLITNSAIVANHTAFFGGGISANADDTTYIDNTVITLNTGYNGEDNLYASGVTLTNSYTSGDAMFLSDPSAGMDGIWGTFDDDYGDLRLSPASPLINAGDNAFAVDSDGPLASDCRGASRFIGAAVDIGPYEYQQLPGDANGDEQVNLDDFIILKQNYGTSSPQGASQGDFNVDNAVNLDDFIILKQNYGTTLAPAAAAETLAPTESAEAPATEESYIENSPAKAPPALALEKLLQWNAPLQPAGLADAPLDIIATLEPIA